MSTLTRTEIAHRLGARKSLRLTISPLLDPGQINDSSIDLRLGNQFIVFRRHTQPTIDPAATDHTALHRLQERRVVAFGQDFVLHPGALALAATFEFVQLPGDLEGQLEGRSSWARLGLQIATASFVEPGFSGVITFELSNIGNMPLRLPPGRRIAQLILRETSSIVTAPYGKTRKYQSPIGPQFSRVSSDADVDIFKSFN